MEELQRQKQTLFNKALFFLQFRARSEHEMREYLQKKAVEYNFNSDIVEVVITQLIEKKFLSDKDFAEALIHSRSSLNLKGDFAIAQELRKKGVNQNIIDAGLQENTVSEYERALENLSKKKDLLNKLAPEKRKQKVFGHLQRRGFSYDISKRAYEACFGNTQTEYDA